MGYWSLFGCCGHCCSAETDTDWHFWKNRHFFFSTTIFKGPKRSDRGGHPSAPKTHFFDFFAPVYVAYRGPRRTGANAMQAPPGASPCVKTRLAATRLGPLKMVVEKKNWKIDPLVFKNVNLYLSLLLTKKRGSRGSPPGGGLGAEPPVYGRPDWRSKTGFQYGLCVCSVENRCARGPIFAWKSDEKNAHSFFGHFPIQIRVTQPRQRIRRIIFSKNMKNVKNLFFLIYFLGYHFFSFLCSVLSEKCQNSRRFQIWCRFAPKLSKMIWVFTI